MVESTQASDVDTTYAAQNPKTGYAQFSILQVTIVKLCSISEPMPTPDVQLICF
jgi:hypothetical protein